MFSLLLKDLISDFIFGLLKDRNKAMLLLLQEKEKLLSELGGYIQKCLDKRNTSHIKSTKSIK